MSFRDLISNDKFVNSTSDRKMNEAKILLSKTKKLTLILILYFSETKFDQKQVPEINLCRKKLQTNNLTYSLDHFTTKNNEKFNTTTGESKQEMQFCQCPV